MNSETKTGDRYIGGNVHNETSMPAKTALEVACAVWRVLARWSGRRRQRLHLDRLDAHLLRDIGVTRAQARREARRWFFD